MQDFINSYTKGVKKIPEVGNFIVMGPTAVLPLHGGFSPKQSSKLPQIEILTIQISGVFVKF